MIGASDGEFRPRHDHKGSMTSQEIEIMLLVGMPQRGADTADAESDLKNQRGRGQLQSFV